MLPQSVRGWPNAPAPWTAAVRTKAVAKLKAWAISSFGNLWRRLLAWGHLGDVRDDRERVGNKCLGDGVSVAPWQSWAVGKITR